MKMIEVKNLTFSYGKDKQALHGLNFSVADGEIFGFLGPNGSGKSTTQKILCDRVAFITNGNIVALDTPQNLKEKNSNHRIVVSYLYQGKRKEQTIEAPELKAGIPFAYDEIISIHSQEPTLEDVFIQYTGRGLS